MKVKYQFCYQIHYNSRQDKQKFILVSKKINLVFHFILHNKQFINLEKLEDKLNCQEKYHIKLRLKTKLLHFHQHQASKYLGQYQSLKHRSCIKQQSFHNQKSSIRLKLILKTVQTEIYLKYQYQSFYHKQNNSVFHTTVHYIRIKQMQSRDFHIDLLSKLFVYLGVLQDKLSNLVKYRS